MSIWSSLYTSTSGISAYGNAMGVVGDNVANVGTTGFKGSRAGFAALLGGIGANQQRVGAGVVMSGAEVGFGQGSLQQTGRNLDMAVWGEGWFVLDGNHKGVDGQYFTRDGRFAIDQEGFLVNTGGLRLQGYQFDMIASGEADDIGIRVATVEDAALSVARSGDAYGCGAIAGVRLVNAQGGGERVVASIDEDAVPGFEIVAVEQRLHGGHRCRRAGAVVEIITGRGGVDIVAGRGVVDVVVEPGVVDDQRCARRGGGAGVLVAAQPDAG